MGMVLRTVFDGGFNKQLHKKGQKKWHLND
jgi:hypothetical protein